MFEGLELACHAARRLDFHCLVAGQNLPPQVGQAGAAAMLATRAGGHQRRDEALVHGIDQVPGTPVGHAIVTCRRANGTIAGDGLQQRGLAGADGDTFAQ